jgi:hypothetical protein
MGRNEYNLMLPKLRVLARLSKPKVPARLIVRYRVVVIVQRQVTLLFSLGAIDRFSNGYCRF